MMTRQIFFLAFFILFNKLALSNNNYQTTNRSTASNSYQSYDCGREVKMGKKSDTCIAEPQPFQGPLKWRFIYGLGYRKFSPLGTLQKDWDDYRNFTTRFWWRQHYINRHYIRH